jgi:CRISPR/Cas system CSM-associated protein Csm3 (group 7 of RAMP superfamily)
MMKTYQFNLKLRSDAEPASGFGNELLNSLLPVNEEGKVEVPASHLKGIMRENLYNILFSLKSKEEAEKICGCLFGRAGDDGDDGNSGLVHLTGAVLPGEKKTLTITRTAIDENGMAADTSLRMTEALAKGSVLKGSISCDDDNPVVEKLALLALLSVSAVGGNRTRGAGNCQITIEGKPGLTPGHLLKEIMSAEISLAASENIYVNEGSLNGSVKAVMLTFEASAPLCLPEHPIGQGNVITSGIHVPATAVAGTILTLLSKEDKTLASACFRSGQFRCGPLLAVPDDDMMLPVYISNTHKISKLPLDDAKHFLFGDTMIPDQFLEEDYKWQDKTSGRSMKGTDGVLIVRRNKKVELLKSSDISRFYSAHGVVNGAGDKKDNLFTMESVCIRKLSGLVFLPEQAADVLLKLLKDGRRVSLGRSKTTQGNGMLAAKPWEIYATMEQDYPQVHDLQNRLFIVQSPIVYNEKTCSNASSKDILEKVLRDAGWGELEAESVMTSVLFGWNQLKLGTLIDKTSRVKAKRVILPGSVFLLKEKLSDMREKLVAGLGEDRYAGFGAVLPHPMFATSLSSFDQGKSDSVKKFAKSANDPVYKGYELHAACGKKLSASQIAHLMRCAGISIQEAIKYLKTQISRPAPTCDSWKSVSGLLENMFQQYDQAKVMKMLRVWHDLRNGEANL